MRATIAAGALIAALCSCRVRFDPVESDARNDADNDGPTSDGGGMMISFGERTSSMRKDVTQDTYVNENVPTLNFGADPELTITANPSPFASSLVRFDMSTIAPGTVIVAARLELVHLSTGDEVVGSISLFTLAESWVAGTGLGQLGVANWNERLTATAWTTPGGTTGVALAPAEVPPAAWRTTLDRDAVQAWIDDEMTNFGILVRAANPTAGTHYHFHSSNSTATELRPELVIELAP